MKCTTLISKGYMKLELSDKNCWNPLQCGALSPAEQLLDRLLTRTDMNEFTHRIQWTLNMLSVRIKNLVLSGLLALRF